MYVVGQPIEHDPHVEVVDGHIARHHFHVKRVIVRTNSRLTAGIDVTELGVNLLSLLQTIAHVSKFLLDQVSVVTTNSEHVPIPMTG